jgi:hypothetical protein
VLAFGFVRTGEFSWIAAWREHELSLICLSRKSQSTVSALGPSPGKQQARKTQNGSSSD